MTIKFKFAEITFKIRNKGDILTRNTDRDILKQISLSVFLINKYFDQKHNIQRHLLFLFGLIN